MKVTLDLTEEQIKDLSKQGVKFTSLNIKDRVKTFEDAYKIYINTVDADSGLNNIVNYSGSNEIAKYASTQAKLAIITEVLNEGWTPDWNDSSECKYYPWFDMRNNTLVYDHCSHWTTDSVAGSRLCFKTSAKAEYAGKQFTEIYKQAFLK